MPIFFILIQTQTFKTSRKISKWTSTTLKNDGSYTYPHTTIIKISLIFLSYFSLKKTPIMDFFQYIYQKKTIETKFEYLKKKMKSETK